MYVLVNGGGPKMSPEVEKFFIDKKDIFNAGESKNNQITVTSNKKWYNPATWGKAASSSNLEIFLARNQDMVWSQLYGALSHDCKSMP